jgi:ribose transport system ATP-binding protein
LSELRLETLGLAKAYAAPVLRDVSFALRAGEVHALVGENGAGKSTLCRIVAGLATADAGSMRLDGRAYAPRDKRAAEVAGVRMVRQELGVLPTLTVAENIFLADLPSRAGIVDRRRLRADARRLMDVVGLTDVEPDALAGGLGVGQQQAIEIAAALTRPCRVLILDEPTAALSARETELLFAQIRRLRSEGAAIVYISHRLEELPVVADRVTVLRDGVMVTTRDVRDVSRDELVQLMVGRELAAADESDAAAASARLVNAPVALRVSGLRAGSAVRDVSFEARRGEILGVAGLVGSGRTEALRALFGADRRDAGAIELDGQRVEIRRPEDAVRLGLAFVTEDRKAEGLLLPLSIRANLALGTLRAHAARFGIVRTTAERGEAERLARALAVRSAGVEQPVVELSGGNQQKVAIGRWLARDPRVLLFDEPTRGIDVGARREIYRLMRELATNGKTLVVVSSDLPELLELADRIVVLSLGHVAASYERAAFSQEAIMDAALSRHRAAAPHERAFA